MNPEKIKRAIVIGAASGLLAMSTIVALISLLPLYNRIKQYEETNVLLHTEKSAVALDRFFKNAQNQGLRISQNSQVEKFLSNANSQSINSGETLDAIQIELEKELNQFLVGIVYLDAQNQKQIEVGLPISNSIIQSLKLDLQSSNFQIIGLDKKVYFVVIHPVTASEKFGTSLVLFKIDPLDILKDCTHYSKSCHLLLGLQKREKVVLLCLMLGCELMR